MAKADNKVTCTAGCKAHNAIRQCVIQETDILFTT